MDELENSASKEDIAGFSNSNSQAPEEVSATAGKSGHFSESETETSMADRPKLTLLIDANDPTNNSENKVIDAEVVDDPVEENTEDKPHSMYSSMENMNNENREKELTKSENYSDHVTYNESGVAIYTDPATNIQYKWCNDTNQWVLLNESVKPKSDEVLEDKDKKNDETNIYENEHYRWDPEQNKWIPKTVENENEFYKWCDEKHEWIPKIQNNDDGDNKYKYDKELGQHTYTDKEGMTFFWDTSKNAWFPKIDDDFMAYYQMNYGFIDNTEAKDEKQADQLIVESMSDTCTTDLGEKKVAGKRKAPPEPPKWFEMPEDQISKVYVSNLPFDIDEEEFTELMSKFGMIFRDPETQKLKIKLYRDSNGEIKGDGLVHYIKVESVDLAIHLLDGTKFKNKNISVQRAKFQMRGEYNPTLKPKRKKKDKEKIKKIQEKLFDWRPERMRGERAKHERVVILKNLFTPEQFVKEVQLIIEYQNDLKEECSKCGKVRKVIVYDRHPEGVAQVSMADAEEADLVIQLMNGRYFGQRKLIAETWDGKTKYKIDETETENKERLSNWDKFLESEEYNEETTKLANELNKEEDQKCDDVEKVNTNDETIT